MREHKLVEEKRIFPRSSAYENPRIPGDNPQETEDALAHLKDHWCICDIFHFYLTKMGGFLAGRAFSLPCKNERAFSREGF